MSRSTWVRERGLRSASQRRRVKRKLLRAATRNGWGVERLEGRCLLSAFSIWPESAAAAELISDSPVEVGVKFRSDVPGTITGLRFYKADTDPGISHTLSLWSTGGTPARLGSGVVAGDNSTGWRQVDLADGGVAINAGETYVASYFAPDGWYGVTRYYADPNGYFTFPTDAAPLHALANGADGGNGVFRYSSTSQYPNSSANGKNFWVDVVFQEAVPPAMTAQWPAADAEGVPTTTLDYPSKGPKLTVAFNEPIVPATLSFVLRDGGGSVIAAEPIAYDAAARTATLVPSSPLAAGVTYTARVSDAQDGDGQSMTSLVSWSFKASTPMSIWNVGGPSAHTEAVGVEVGVRFRSDADGFVAGIRFYKGGASNRGVHIGNLWTNNGVKLASAVFTNETDSGWQQVMFGSAVPITANTTYIASYHAPGGHYSATGGVFGSSGVDNGMLHALQVEVDSGNGVYAYSDVSTFPVNGSGSGVNYWVDLVFTRKQAFVGSGDGLRATYFDNQDFTGSTVTRVDPQVDFDWQTSSPAPGIAANTYSATWTGEIQAQYDETYTFHTYSDNAARVWVNGQLILDAFASHGGQWDVSTPIALTAGQKYSIRMDYYQAYSGAQMILCWSSESTPKSIVPQSQLYAGPAPGPAPGTGDGLRATYFDNQDFTGATVARVDPQVAFDWGTGSPDPAIGGDTFSATWTGQIEPQFNETYTFYTFSDNGARLWVDGQLILDAFTSHPPREDVSTTISLVAGQKYNIRLDFFEAYSGAAMKLLWSSNSVPKSVVPMTQLYSLAGPTNLAATTVSYSQIDLSWVNNSPDNPEFMIERRTAGGSFAVLTKVGAGATSHSDTNLPADTQYFYRIFAVNGSQSSSYSNEAQATTASAPPPAAPAAQSLLTSARKSTRVVDSLFSRNLIRPSRPAK